MASSGVPLDGAIKQLEEVVRDAMQLRQILKRLSVLAQSLDESVGKARETMAKARQCADRLATAAGSLPEVSLLLSQVEEKLQDLEKQQVGRFARGLDEELSKRGLSLEKHGGDFQAGFFTIEPDAAHNRVRLWYGPKEEHLCQVGFSPEKVAVELERWKKRLGAGLASEKFLSRLREAYSRVVRIGNKKPGEPVPINEVLFELAVVLQAERFRRNPKKEFFRDYTRADFSVDLFRLRVQGGISALRLEVATRSFTRNKKDYLWIPDNDHRCSGTTYSHLYFLERQ